MYQYAQPEPTETPLSRQVRGARIAEDLLAKQIESTLARVIAQSASLKESREIMSQSDIQTLADGHTIPCPSPGYEHPTYADIQRMFARNEREKTERIFTALRAPTMSARAQEALSAFGLPLGLPASTHG